MRNSVVIYRSTCYVISQGNVRLDINNFQREKNFWLFYSNYVCTKRSLRIVKNRVWMINREIDALRRANISRSEPQFFVGNCWKLSERQKAIQNEICELVVSGKVGEHQTLQFASHNRAGFGFLPRKWARHYNICRDDYLIINRPGLHSCFPICNANLNERRTNGERMANEGRGLVANLIALYKNVYNIAKNYVDTLRRKRSICLYTSIVSNKLPIAWIPSSLILSHQLTSCFRLWKPILKGKKIYTVTLNIPLNGKNLHIS